MPKVQYSTDGFPIYDKEDGWKDYGEFEAAALNDMDRISSKKTKEVQNQQSQNGTPLGSMAAGMLPTVGAVAGGAIEPAGGEIPGAAIGTALKNVLRSASPSTFGANPPTALGQAGDAASDWALSSLPAVGTVARIAGNIGSKLPMAGKAIQSLMAELPSLSKSSQMVIKGLLQSVQPIVKGPSVPSSSTNQDQ
jgi:hypothetical protein